jgi:hypothetical protein
MWDIGNQVYGYSKGEEMARIYYMHKIESKILFTPVFI